MQCEEFEDRLDAVLDERRRPEWNAELRLHCEMCVQCRRLAAAYEMLFDGFHELATPEAPDSMPRRVVNRWHADRVRAEGAWLSVTVAAAAVVLLAAMLPMVRGTTPVGEHASSRPSAVKSAATPLANVLEPLPGTLDLPLDADQGDPYAGLAKETGQNLANVMLYVPGIGGGMGIMDPERGPDEEPSWAEQMGEGLRPVTDSVTETLNLLLDSLPPVTAMAAR